MRLGTSLNLQDPDDKDDRRNTINDKRYFTWGDDSGCLHLFPHSERRVNVCVLDRGQKERLPKEYG